VANRFKRLKIGDTVITQQKSADEVLYAMGFHWLRYAEFENAEIEIKKNTVIWVNGTWYWGDWKFGVWLNGTWLGGNWLGGVWKDGTWLGGKWFNGLWKGKIKSNVK
jgi:hypothetical protein